MEPCDWPALPHLHKLCLHLLLAFIAHQVGCTNSIAVSRVLLLQVLRWSFLALRGDFNVQLAMTEEPRKMQIHTELMQVCLASGPHLLSFNSS